jgi:hypothetical protein
LFWASPRVQASERASSLPRIFSGCTETLQSSARSRKTSGLLPLRASSEVTKSRVRVGGAFRSGTEWRCPLWRWPTLCSPPPLERRALTFCPVDDSAREVKALSACLTCGLPHGGSLGVPSLENDAAVITEGDLGGINERGGVAEPAPVRSQGARGSGVDEPRVSLSNIRPRLEYTFDGGVADSGWSREQVDGVVPRCDDLGGSTRGGLARCSFLLLLLELAVRWGVEPLVRVVGALGFEEGSEEEGEGRSLEQINCMPIIAGLIRRRQ